MTYYEGKVNINQLKALIKNGFNPTIITEKNGNYLVAVVLQTGKHLEDVNVFKNQLKELKSIMPRYIKLVNKLKASE